MEQLSLLMDWLCFGVTADMRERLRVPHWQLRVLEIDALLGERQTVGVACDYNLQMTPVDDVLFDTAEEIYAPLEKYK